MYRVTKDIGRVYDVSWNPPKEYCKYGIYQYKIAWSGEPHAAYEGWTINDITAGNIVPIDNPASIKVLYGKV